MDRWTRAFDSEATHVVVAGDRYGRNATTVAKDLSEVREIVEAGLENQDVVCMTVIKLPKALGY